MIRPSNSGIATWVRRVQRGQPVVVRRPGRAAAGQAQALQDPARRASASAPTSHASSSPPAWAVAGLRAAGREHGDDQRVRGAQRRRAGPGPAGRSDAVKTGSAWPPGVLDRRAQRLDERGVPGHVVRPVVEDGDRRAGGGPGRPREHAPSPARPPAARNPWPVSSTVSDRKSVQLRPGCPGRRGRGRRAPRRPRPTGTVDSSISSASGACSPPSTTTGRGPASSASRPSCQARRPPRMRTTTRSPPSSRAGQVVGVEAGRVGQPVRRRRWRGR